MAGGLDRLVDTPPPSRYHSGHEPRPQHSLHHERRPCVACDELLRQPHQPYAPSRPHRGRRDAVRQLLLHQLDLHAEPGRDPDWHLQPHERRHHAGHHDGQPPADVPEAAAGRRLPDRARRQVAPGPGPGALAHRVRLLDRIPRPGPLSQPRNGGDDRTQGGPGLRHRHRDRPVAALAGAARPFTALPADVPPQGAAPPLGPASTPRAPLRRRGNPLPGDLRRRLRAPRTRRGGRRDAH